MNHPRKRRALSSLSLGLLAALLPVSLVSPAQTGTLAGSVQALPAPIADESPARPRTSPLAPGFDVAGFEAIARHLTDNGRVPGMAMAIVHDGQVLSARGYGVTDVNRPEPIDAHTVFRLASLSKAFAGTMTGLLVNDGVLRWDSKVTDFLPDFRLSSPEATRRLTVADLVSQRSGLGHNAYDPDLEANADYRSLVRKMAYTPLACMPGDCYGYQNVAFSLVGDIAFNASGSFYEQLVERRIFKPLGMNDASLGLAGIEGSPRWARPHVRGGRGWVPLTPKPAYYRVAPAAGVNASISDMAQWLVAHTGHRPDVLPAPLLATLHAPLISTPGERRAGWRRERISEAGYAIGWRVFEYAGHRVVFHAGAVQGYRGMIAMIPDEDFGTVILWNSESPLPSGLLPTILDRALGLPARKWMDIDTGFGDDTLYVERGKPQESRGVQAVGGGSPTRSKASPR